MFTNKQIGISNQDKFGMDSQRALDYYLEIAKDWKDPLPKPIIMEDPLEKSRKIIREDLIGIGSKARFGDLLISSIKQKEVVYVAPRYGWAPKSLISLCKRYDKKLTLFMPSSKEISDHQASVIEEGAKAIFVRVAAMPNLNRIAEKYANEKNDAYFIPLGLKHPLVTACIVKVCYDLFKDIEQPNEMWSVISTGVLTRGLQIALPKTNFHAVAVARNIHNGELGSAKYYTYHKPFHKNAEIAEMLPFEMAKNYDAKGYEIFAEHASSGAYFWNVAGEMGHNLDKKIIDSYRDWGHKIIY